MHRLQKRSAKDLFRHDTTSWMEFVHQLDFRTRALASGCPLVVMVESTHDWMSNYLVPNILSGRNRTALFREPLRNPLMRPGSVEVGHIGIEHALELPLLQDQQVIQAFLSHTSQEAFTDGIGSWGMNRRLEKFDATGPGNSAEMRSILAVAITDQILRCLPKRGSFSQLLGDPRIGRGSCHTHMDHLA